MLQPSGIVNYLLNFLPQVTRNTEWLSNQDIALAGNLFYQYLVWIPVLHDQYSGRLQGISEDLYESAAIDGATLTKRFIHITIPQLKPILISIAMLDFIWTLQSFNVIWMLTGGGPINSTETLSIYIYSWRSRKLDYSMASTAATVLLVVCVVYRNFLCETAKESEGIEYGWQLQKIDQSHSFYSSGAGRHFCGISHCMDDLFVSERQYRHLFLAAEVL